MDKETVFPYVLVDLCGGGELLGGYDANGNYVADSAEIIAAESQRIVAESRSVATLRSHLKYLLKDKAIEDFAFRGNLHVGYQLRIVARQEFLEKIQKLEFVMRLRDPLFRITKQTVVYLSEEAVLSTSRSTYCYW